MIVVFGGGGQLGQELARAAAARHVPLTALLRAQTDITNKAAVREAIARHGASLIVNASAYTKVDLAEEEIAAASAANEHGPAQLAAACAEANLPLVHISTDYVFDGAKQSAYVEGDPIAPINFYGRSKASGERAVREKSLQHVIVRTSWLYGEFGNNFLKTMLRLAATHDELRVVSDQRGCPTSTRDLAHAILNIVPRLVARDDVWGTYHFAGTGATSWHGFASRIVAAQAPLTGRIPRVIAIPTTEFPTPAPRPANSELDCSLFGRTFGFYAHAWTQEADEITVAAVTTRMEQATHAA